MLFWGCAWPAFAGGRGGAAADASSAASATDVPAVAAPASSIPDVPPPGWTEEQLAALRTLELQLRHEDTELFSHHVKPILYYSATLFVQDTSPLRKTRPLCVRRLRVDTDESYKEVHYGQGRCLGYEFFTFITDILAIPREIRIRSARMDVAPYRDAPSSDVLRNLDAIPALRAVPLPPVKLTLSGRPLPKLPENIPAPTEKNPWPVKLRVHLVSAFTDTRDPDLRCYAYSVTEVPLEAESLSGFHVRTNIGDYKSMGWVAGFVPVLCVPGGTDHIDIKHSTIWLGSDMRKLKAVNAGPMLVDDGFVPLPFVTDKGPLPPPADGMYPPRPRKISLGYSEESGK